MSVSLNSGLAQSELTSQYHKQVAEVLRNNTRGEGLKDGKHSLSTENIVNASQTVPGFEDSLSPQDTADIIYAFSDSPQAPADQFSEAQKNRIRDNIQHFSDVAKLKFRESTNAASSHIQFKVDNGSFAWKDPYYVSATNGAQGSVDIPLLQRHAKALENPNNYASHVIAKALAFKLGLPATNSVAGVKGAHENTLAYSLRSPYSEVRTGHRFGKVHLSDQYASTPMMDDIALLQKKFGANHEARSSDTTYGFNSNADRETFRLKSPADLPVFCVWDGGGKDTFDFSEYAEDQLINLTQGGFSNIGGGKGNVSIAQGAHIERAIGGKGNDLIIGNERDNELMGGEGDDILYVTANSGFNKLWGGPGKNTFVIGASEPSATLENTMINDFVSGKDKLDVSALRAASGKPALKVVANYTGEGGEVTIDYFESQNTSLLRFDINGDGKVDCMLSVEGRIALTDIIG